jgi:hypothetical protein
MIYEIVSRRGWTCCCGVSPCGILWFASQQLWPASTCFAQDNSTGALRGIVIDPVKRRVPGATIALVNNATGFRYQQMSDIEGHLAFQLLPPGEYSARVISDGMSPQLNDHLEIDLGGSTEIDFRLTIAGVRESVTVSAETKAIETEPRGTSAVIDERAIANLPLNGRRFY